ncbi:arsenate reductase family protein [Enterococcus sp. LJL51]|uniref:arsenate reductase family protein n=1 Tax=Enterococcus sp. LJL51 TaxID=3416656 RepID=UPI003CF3C7A6
MYTFFWYPKCSTCKKAKAWLDASGVDYEIVDMIETPPTKEQLLGWMEESPLPVRRFFNTSGGHYREQGLKEIVNDFSNEEAAERLSKDGMLNKRPIFVKDGHFITNGFKESEYEGAISK